jgi:hypothetical protein
MKWHSILPPAGPTHPASWAYSLLHSASWAPECRDAIRKAQVIADAASGGAIPAGQIAASGKGTTVPPTYPAAAAAAGSDSTYPALITAAWGVNSAHPATAYATNHGVDSIDAAEWAASSNAGARSSNAAGGTWAEEPAGPGAPWPLGSAPSSSQEVHAVASEAAKQNNSALAALPTLPQGASVLFKLRHWAAFPFAMFWRQCKCGLFYDIFEGIRSVEAAAMHAAAEVFDKRTENVFQALQVSGFRFQVSGFRFQVSGFRFQVSGFRFPGASGWCCSCLFITCDRWRPPLPAHHILCELAGVPPPMHILRWQVSPSPMHILHWQVPPPPPAHTALAGSSLFSPPSCVFAACSYLSCWQGTLPRNYAGVFAQKAFVPNASVPNTPVPNACFPNAAILVI